MSSPKQLRRCRRRWRRSVPGVLGIHIEGPFLNVERKGIHDPEKFRELDPSAVKLLTSLRGGRTLVTLAPEMTTPAMIRKLVDAGVVVSAGHTNATYEQIQRRAAGRTDRLHASVQRDVTADRPRARRGGRSAG